MKNATDTLSLKRALTSGDLPPGNQRVRHLTLPELKSGMVLASPLYLSKNSRTELRMPAGLVLSEATLGLLAGYRAASVCVYESPHAPHAGMQMMAAMPVLSADHVAGGELAACPLPRAMEE